MKKSISEQIYLYSRMKLPSELILEMRLTTARLQSIRRTKRLAIYNDSFLIGYLEALKWVLGENLEHVSTK